MDYIIKLSDQITDFDGYVEVMNLSDRFDGKAENIEEIIRVNNRLVNSIYKMTLTDLVNVLSEAVTHHEHIVTPTLPQYCIKHVWLNRAAQEQAVYIEVPKNKWDITYHSQVFENVGFPRMIFKYFIKGKNVTLSNIVAVKDKGFIKDDTPLFIFPFSNVERSTKVCMGSNQLPPIDSIVQVSTFHAIFFAAPFGDCYGAKTTTGKTLRELFTSLTHNDFEDEWLIPTGINFDTF
ncbi:hypothetical protein [Mesobacillus zeae]|uniref:hypothetical protein n=1 Tax=Mesobacillus zeae TaxID=1917180 RepID=UPI00300B9988